MNLPGCPVQPDNITETLLALVLHLGGIGPTLDLDEQGRPVPLFGRTAHESCDRAGLAESGQYSATHGDGRCLVKLGCRGPVVKCNVPDPRVGERHRRLPERGRHLHGLHDARASRTSTCRSWTPTGSGSRPRAPRGSRTARCCEYFRQRSIERKYDVEPEWRKPSPELTTGYAKRW